MSQKHCTIILGMHRSGTSALAGCLNIMGVNFGKTIMPGNEANQAGYFENQDIVLAHDILLRDLGCRWDMVGSLPQDWQDGQAAAKAAKTLTGILERQFLDQDQPFAVKDPRLCRLMPLWSSVLHKLQIRPCLILVLRHPMEVAKSLQKRDGLDLLKGHLLWLVHNREALAACKDMDHALLTFDQLLADPVQGLQAASSLQALDGFNPSQYAQEILQFIRADLKHQHQGAAEEIKDGLFRHYAWIYDQFRKIQAKQRTLRLESAASHGGDTSCLPEVIAGFPLAFSGSALLPLEDERKQAAEVLDNLLRVIGRHEQAELDQAIQLQRRLLSAQNAAETLYAQVFFPVPEAEDTTYSKEASCRILLAPGEWQQLAVEIPQPEVLRKSRLQLAPLNTRGVVSVSGIKLINAANGQICWSVPEGYKGCTIDKDALVLSRGETLQLAVTGNYPCLFLPELPDLPDCPMRLEIWIKAERKQDILHTSWKDLLQNKKNLTTKRDELQKARNQLQQKLEKLQNEAEEKENALRQELEDSQAKEKERLKELEQAQDKEKDLLQQLDAQKSLTREYFELLTQAEYEQELSRKQLQEKQSQYQDLEQKLKDQEALTSEYFHELAKADQTLEEEKQQEYQKRQALEQKLESQEQLTKKYFHELSKSESSLLKKQKLEQDLRQENKTLWNNINRLHKDFLALMSSKRWKTGDKLIRLVEILLLRKKQPLAVDQMQKVFATIQSQVKSGKAAIQEIESPGAHPGHVKQLQTWLRQLNKDFQALQKSQRWKLGNILIRPVEILTFRAGQPTARDHLQQIFQEYEESLTSYKGLDYKTMEKWLRQAGKDFQALKDSKRWKLGHSIFSLLDRLLLRGKKPTAMDHALEIVGQFESRQQ